MTFNSLPFLLLLWTTFLLYWRLGRRAQNLLLLIASYVFYGWWDWRFLGLMAFSTVLDFWCGLGFREGRPFPLSRRACLWLSVGTNLTVLCFFKYFGFFVDSAVELLNALGFEASPWTLRIILPVGISFYTFQTMSYVLDLHRGTAKPSEDLVEFAAFVSFFPQLVAGPIERASHLLGQFSAPRTFDAAEARDGLRQAFWGMFKKIVIADPCGLVVNRIYGRLGEDATNGGHIAAATFLFAIQIYADFSAYSDIACGTARLFGFRLMRNFATPYFSRDAAEFWRRWHISLSTWFRDYVYIPLGGNRHGTAARIRNVMITFTLSGLWHGANWTFVLWGFVNGLLVLVWNRGARPGSQPGEESWRDAGKILPMFVVTCLVWVLFRAQSLHEVALCYGKMGDALWALSPAAGTAFLQTVRDTWYLAALLLVVEWFARRRQHPLELAASPVALRWTVYVVLLFLIFILGDFQSDVDFIYFQF